MEKILRILFEFLAMVCLSVVVRGQEGIIIPFEQLQQLLPLPVVDFPLLPPFGGLLSDGPEIGIFGSFPIPIPQRRAPVQRIPMRQRIISRQFRNPRRRVPLRRRMNNFDTSRLTPVTRPTPEQLRYLSQIRIDLSMLPNFGDPLGYLVGNRMIEQLLSFIQATSRSVPFSTQNGLQFPNQLFPNERQGRNFPNFNRFLGGMANNNILQFNPLQSNRRQTLPMGSTAGQIPTQDVDTISRQQFQMPPSSREQNSNTPNINQFQLPIENINQETAQRHPLLLLPNQRSAPERPLIPTPSIDIVNPHSISNDGTNTANEQPNPSNIDIARQMSGLVSGNNDIVITTPAPKKLENTQQNLLNEQTAFRMDEVIEVYHPNKERNLCFSGRNLPKDFLSRVMKVITFAIQGPRSETICSTGPLSLPELQHIEEMMIQETGNTSPSEILLANYKDIPSTTVQSQVQNMFTVDSGPSNTDTTGQSQQGNLSGMVSK